MYFVGLGDISPLWAVFPSDCAPNNALKFTKPNASCWFGTDNCTYWCQVWFAAKHPAVAPSLWAKASWGDRGPTWCGAMSASWTNIPIIIYMTLIGDCWLAAALVDGGVSGGYPLAEHGPAACATWCLCTVTESTTWSVLTLPLWRVLTKNILLGVGHHWAWRCPIPGCSPGERPSLPGHQGLDSRTPSLGVLLRDARLFFPGLPLSADPFPAI